MQNKKEIIKVSYPIFLGLLAQNIINVTDTAFLGHVGEVELGASALGGLYYICLFTLAFGFSIGAQILMARRNGEGKYQELGTVLNQGSLFSFLMAIVLLVGAMLSARPVMQLMLSSEVILEASYDFFSVRVWGLLFSFVNVMYRAFYVAIIRTKVLTLNAIVMASINVILDYILIFGKFGIGGSCDCLGHGGGGFVALLPALHAVCGGREKVRAQVPLASRFPGHQAHSERFRIHDAATIHSLHHVVCILPRHRTHRATGTCHCQCSAEHLRPCPDTGAGALDNSQYISQQCHWFKSH